LLRRTPITLELAIYSFLLFVPLGLATGLLAGWKPESRFDNTFRSLAFFGTSVPPFILALAIMGVFYVNLGWFAPGRISYEYTRQILEEGYRHPTGFLTIDSLLNGRFDIFLDALKHLAMPVVALAVYHWATLGRIMRATIVSEREKDYIVAARARGINERRLAWRHSLRPALTPSLTSIALSAANIVTGVFVIEIIYGIKGVSELLVSSMKIQPDAPAALGFAVYSVIMVISLMVTLDIAQAVFDPRVRGELSR
jgi:ABC-type dipeptide/oligopeptide/nickel transport system permease component